MATTTGSLTAAAITDMLEVFTNDASLTLQAWSAADPTAAVLDSVSVTYASPSGGSVDLSTSATLSLVSGETVDTVRLYTGATKLAETTLTTDNAFPDGGDLIVSSFEISVT